MKRKKGRVFFSIEYCIDLTVRIIHHHHHHVGSPAQISLTLSRHLSLSSIAPGGCSRLYPVSAQSCCILALAGHPTFAHPYKGVHRSMLLMSLSLLLQQCPAYQVCLTWIVFVMAIQLLLCGMLPLGLVQYCSQHSCVIAIKLLLHTFSVHVVHPYSSMDPTTAWKKLCFILLVRSGFHMTDSQLIAVYAFPSHMLMSVLVDGTLLVY